MNDLYAWLSTFNLEEMELVEMVANYSAIFWSNFSGEIFRPPQLLWAQISFLPVYHCSTDTADFINTSYLSVIHFKIKLWTMTMKNQESCEILLFTLAFCHDVDYVQSLYCLDCFLCGEGFNFSLSTVSDALWWPVTI